MEIVEKITGVFEFNFENFSITIRKGDTIRAAFSGKIKEYLEDIISKEKNRRTM